MTAPSRFRQWRSSVWNFNVANRDAWVARAAASVAAGSRVLDVGAGPGRYRNLFAHCDYRAHDFAREPGTVGRYTTLDYESDITSIPVADASFDVVLCTEVLEHVPEPIAAVRELARILRSGGRLFLTAPLGSWLHQEPYHFYGGYTPHWYRRFLPEAGLQIDSLEANGGFFSFYGQETNRFRDLVHPSRTWRLGPLRWIGTTLIWLLTLPLSQLMPLLAGRLDALRLENIATVGYHVAATKR